MDSKKTKPRKQHRNLNKSEMTGDFKLQSPTPKVMPPLEDIDEVLNKNKKDSKINVLESNFETASNNNEITPLMNGIRLFIGNFPYGTIEKDLMELFHPFNPQFVIIKNNNNRKYSTQAFIFFLNIFDMRKAVDKFDRKTYYDHVLLVISPYMSGVTSTETISHSFKSIEEFQGKEIDELPPGMIVGKGQLQKVEQFLQFVVFCYVPWWVSAPVVAAAPNNDLKLIENVNQYKIVDIQLSSAALKAIEKAMTLSNNSTVNFYSEAARLSHIYKEFSLESKLLTNEIVVCVTRVVNSHCFWAYIVDKKVERYEESILIQKFLQETAFFWKKTNVVGRCAAMYCGKWFRGYILNVSGKNAEVFLVDIGITAKINLQLIRLSPDSIWKISPMARSFEIPETFNELSENSVLQNLPLVILQSETASSNYITVVKIKN
ncbi:hypothetical protein Ahia01_001014000 [Argonauta hians]